MEASTPPPKDAPDSHLVQMGDGQPDTKSHQTCWAHPRAPQGCRAGRMGSREQQRGARGVGPVGAESGQAGWAGTQAGATSAHFQPKRTSESASAPSEMGGCKFAEQSEGGEK